jgi:hypothetical protein
MVINGSFDKSAEIRRRLHQVEGADGTRKHGLVHFMGGYFLDYGRPQHYYVP